MEMREHKKETKCGFGGVSMYDQQGIEKKLADMARKGWLIEEMQNAFFWTVVSNRRSCILPRYMPQ